MKRDPWPYVHDHESGRAYAERVLRRDWPCSYWSREDQVNAVTDGWYLAVGNSTMDERTDRIYPSYQAGNRFQTVDEAVAHVLAQAKEGSDLHCRAIVLHTTSVLKYGHEPR